MRSATFMFSLVFLFTVASEAFNRDREGNFRRGRAGAQRGNEGSERPNRVPVGSPQWGGNGCPAGTMNVSFAPDNLSFTILFDQFVAETAPGGSGVRRDVMTCNALIPIEIPPNMQMEITRVDYRGFIALPAQSRAVLHALYNFRGRGGDGDRLNLRFNFQGPLTETYTLTTDLVNRGGTGTEISPCGGSTVLRVYNQLKIVSRNPSDIAQATIDSIDGQANAVYYVNWKACTSASQPNRPGRGGRNR